MWAIAGLGVVVVLLAAALWGPIVSKVEQPKYVVVEKNNEIEIRDYAPMIVAETEVSGERDKAIREGFRAIAAYIFGDNSSAQKVAMTAPVTQQGNEKIAMTAPVTQQGDGHVWQVRFVMPCELHDGIATEAKRSGREAEGNRRRALRGNSIFWPRD